MTPTLAKTLLHDIGKYGARAARNFRDDPPTALVQMLVRDLYGREGEPTLSERFAILDPGDEALSETRTHLRAIDALRAEVTSGDADAAIRAARHARAIEEALRALAAALPESEPRS